HAAGPRAPVLAAAAGTRHGGAQRARAGGGEREARAPVAPGARVMLLAGVLLYVGAVLCINGIWLLRGPRGGASALYIQGREVAVINLFTGFVGSVVATTLLVQGNRDTDLASVRGGAFILLFAFTYLWVALNAFLNAGGRAFGWYCLFVAITAV